MRQRCRTLAQAGLPQGWIGGGMQQGQAGESFMVLWVEMQQVFVMVLCCIGLSRLPGQAGQSNQGITISRILGQGLPITGLGAFVQAHGQCLISSDCGGLKVVCAGRSCFANARRSRWQRLGTGVGAVRCCFVASF